MHKRCQSTAELCNIDNDGCDRYYVYLITNIYYWNQYDNKLTVQMAHWAFKILS